MQTALVTSRASEIKEEQLAIPFYGCLNQTRQQANIRPVQVSCPISKLRRIAPLTYGGLRQHFDGVRWSI